MTEVMNNFYNEKCETLLTEIKGINKRRDKALLFSIVKM